MALNRSWIGRNRYNEAKYLTEEYKVGVENFIKHAIENMQKEDNGRVRCPCRECGNSFYKYPSAVRVDLYRHGIMSWYTIWDCHGEEDMPSVQVGTSSSNTNYRDDDMYDAHDDDFVDCENFEEPNATAKEFYRMVQSAGPNSQKGKSSKGSRKVTVNEGCGEESIVEPEFTERITYERKQRSCSEGRYSKKPPIDARPTVHFVKPKTIIEPEAKHTLQHIVRIRWDENTINTKGSNREVFYDGCILKFQEYYKYPDGYEIPQRDRIVRAHLKKNFKQLRELMKIGYTDSEIDLELLKPHYYSQRAWNSILEYWGTIQFETRPVHGQKARKMVEFTPRTGAISYNKRRGDIDAEREAKGDMPILDDELMGLVYDPCEPAVIELQARPPNRGRVLLRPQSTVGELLGAREAAQWVSSKEKTSPHDNVIADEIYSRMSTILDDVRQMVCSLPMREVKKSDLDERVRNLAAAALPDPSQHAS
ncbi:hypothetical protein POM88_016859 [Heracleum sosnowskyi]|uniref:Transposase-associated domain-containing protein n=1 Tax=Heracleum sosnowskyi TaxID=360622 RepID=A0AAD8MXD4_9APIA|nr:hypothetical protein POM88_016859 [Heracleum sosnowskyi]